MEVRKKYFADVIKKVVYIPQISIEFIVYYVLPKNHNHNIMLCNAKSDFWHFKELCNSQLLLFSNILLVLTYSTKTRFTFVSCVLFNTDMVDWNVPPKIPLT